MTEQPLSVNKAVTERGLLRSPAILSGLLLIPITVLGMFGVVTGPIVGGLFVAHLIALLCAQREALHTITSAPRTSSSSKLPLAYIACGLILLVTAALALLPVTARDALIQHVAVPSWWLRDGELLGYPGHTVSFYPMLGSTPYLALLGFGFPPEACALYNLLYLLPFAGGVAMLMQQLIPTNSAEQPKQNAALIAALITLSTPMVLRLGSEPLVDLQLATYCVFGLALLLKGQAMLAGIALGLALSTKPNAMPFVFFTLLAAPLFGRSLRSLIGVSAVALIVASPWYLRNFAVTGNPFFPLGGAEGNTGTTLTSFESRLLIYGESFFDLLLTPLTMLWNGADEDPRRFDGVLSPLFVLALVGVWKLRHQKQVIACALIAIAYFIVAQIMSGARIRYLMPILPIPIVLTAIAFTMAIPARIRAILLVAQLGWAALYLGQRAERLHAVSYLLGDQTRGAYLAKALPEYNFIQKLREVVPPDAHVYNVLTGNRFLYMPFRTSSAGYLSGQEMVRWIKAGTATSELNKRGAQFVLVHMQLWNRLAEGAVFEPQLTLVRAERQYALFAVPSEN